MDWCLWAFNGILASAEDTNCQNFKVIISLSRYLWLVEGKSLCKKRCVEGRNFHRNMWYPSYDHQYGRTISVNVALSLLPLYIPPPPSKKKKNITSTGLKYFFKSDHLCCLQLSRCFLASTCLKSLNSTTEHCLGQDQWMNYFYYYQAFDLPFPLRLSLIHLGHFCIGAAGPVAMGAIPALSATWFPPQERVAATALGTSIGMSGVAISFILGKEACHLFWLFSKV